MTKTTFAALLPLALLMLGCGEQENNRADGPIPQGAVPAAPDVRPGAEGPAPGATLQPGAEAVSDTVVGAPQPVEPLERVTPDTVR